MRITEKIYRLIIVIYSFSILCISYADNANIKEFDDTLKITNLPEIEVTSKEMWVEGNTMIAIPNKHVKNLSNSPIDLIERIGFPGVNVVNGKVQTPSGEIPIYINGKPVTEIDVSTFWAKNVLRVEYQTNPDKIIANGGKQIINIQMRDYLIGGLTKLNATQIIPNNGLYSVSSKLNYKKITWGLNYETTYDNDSRSKIETNDHYLGLFIDGELTNVIKDQNSSLKKKTNHNVLTISNIYSTQTFRMVHFLRGGIYDIPKNSLISRLTYSAGNLNSNSSEYFSNSQSKLIETGGSYRYSFQGKSALDAGWSYGFSRNENLSKLVYPDLKFFENNFKEYVNKFSLSVAFTHMLNEKWYMGYNISNNSSYFNAKYSGTTNSNSKQFNTVSQLGFSIIWQPSINMWFLLKPSVQNIYRTEGGIKVLSHFSPSAEFNFGYSDQKHWQLFANIFYYNGNPSISTTSDVTIRTDEFNWIQGNPKLKVPQHWNANLGFVYFPSNVLTLNPIIEWSKTIDEIVDIYNLRETKDGIVKTFSNSSNIDRVSLYANITVRLFNNSLVFTTDPEVKLYNGSCLSNKNKLFFRMRGNLRYYIKNFGFTLKYFGKENDLSNGGTVLFTASDSWDFSVQYGTDSFILSLGIDNIFRNKKTSIENLNTTNFTSKTKTWNTGRKIKIEFSYSFGYGKKVDPSFQNFSTSKFESSEVK